MSAPNFVDLIGQRFGKRVVIARAETPIYRGKKGSSRWILRCDCGNISTVQTCGVKSSTHCGCGNQEAAIQSGLSRKGCRRGQYKLVSPANYDKAKHLGSTFNMTIPEWDEKKESQNNQCDICDREFVYTPHVDHDHSCCPGKKSCGKCIRSLLCHNCNTALGNLQDSPELLRKAADYIEKWREIMKSKTAESHDLTTNQKQKPQTVGVSGPGPFKGTRAGEKRAGSTKYQDYPGELGSNPAYKGGVGDCK